MSEFLLELHVYLCPRCSSATVKPSDESDAPPGEQLLIVSGIGLGNGEEYGFARGVYLTPEGVVECLNRHAEKMEQEAADAGQWEASLGFDQLAEPSKLARKAKHEKNKASAEGQRAAFFGGAAVPANWQDKSGGELLAELGGEDDE